MPNPLPPDLLADWELTCDLFDADRALSELAGVGRTMPNPHLLIGPFVRREAVLSSRIEGTRANITDLYAYEVGQLPLSGMEHAPISLRPFTPLWMVTGASADYFFRCCWWSGN